MQNATSIQSPSKSNLVTTFKYFSHDFSFDLCHDFSFWQAGTGRCIPKRMNEDPYYSFPSLCNQTEFNCMDIVQLSRKYCPNKDVSCDGYGQGKHFFCNDSKTCIPKGEFIRYK